MITVLVPRSKAEIERDIAAIRRETKKITRSRKNCARLAPQTRLYDQEWEADQAVWCMTRASAFVLGYHGCDMLEDKRAKD